MTLPSDIEDLIEPTRTKPFPSQLNPNWLRLLVALTDTNFCRVAYANTVLHKVGEYYDLRNHVIWGGNFPRLLRRAKQNIPQEWGRQYGTLDFFTHAQVSRSQLWKTLGGGLQSFESACLMISLIDVWLTDEGHPNLVSKTLRIRPALFRPDNFDAELFEELFCSSAQNQARLKDLIKFTRQHSVHTKPEYIFGKLFLKRVASGQSCTIQTAAWIMDFLTQFNRAGNGVTAVDINQLTKAAKGEKLA